MTSWAAQLRREPQDKAKSSRTRKIVAILAVGVLIGNGAACGSDSTASDEAAPTSTIDEPDRFPEGWPEIMALDVGAVITESTRTPSNKGVRRTLTAEIDGIGQNIFATYEDALEWGGYDITRRRPSDGLKEYEWFLVAKKGADQLTVDVWDRDGGTVIMKFTHTHLFGDVG